MAHGGDKNWNATVEEAVAPLRRKAPVAVAFGMATADTLQAAVSALEGQGACRIAVVRMFVSGESFKTETEQILGLRPGAPERPTHDHPAHGGASSGHGEHSMAFWRVASRSAFALSQEGLMEAEQVGEIIADRARDLSRDPARESVLILAHGPEDDAENARWLEHLERRADLVRRTPFRAVVVETLREDWPERRRAAEERIKSFVVKAQDDGGRAIVIPFRLSGFGPYRELLAGFDYISDGRGFLPHPKITEWIERQAAAACAKAGWPVPL